jgi:hypothetical protein
MIRFVDLTGSYWGHPEESAPICAFISTSGGSFIFDDMGAHTFSSMEEIDYAEFDDKERLKRLVPDGFFQRANHLTVEEAEVVIDFIERMTVNSDIRSRPLLFQRMEKWHRQMCDELRERYT